jgi:2-haloacid dehalogenase
VPGQIDLDAFDVLTFDCYGTLIDWETGIAGGLREVLAHAADPPTDELLERYAALEAEAEQGTYRTYREVLATCARGIAAHYGAPADEDRVAAFSGSVGDWPAFPDSAAALRRLHGRFRLGVITNCDDDLFAASNRRLGVVFDWVVTAQQARSYKPDVRNFELALERIGQPPERILHVAQSLYHDHVPARGLGLSTVWVDRRHDRTGFGATPPAEATPNLTVPDMATLAEIASR